MQILSKILREVRAFLPSMDKSKLEKALYYFTPKIDEQKVFEVIEILSKFKVDETTIESCILFMGIEAMNYKKNDFSIDNIEEPISKNFGKEVFKILKLLYSFDILPVNLESSGVENLRMMFLAMAKDIRVVLIRLAMNLQVLINLENLENSEQRKIFARQALEIYIPIAARLGIYSIKSDMEDLAFKYLYPERYNTIYKEVEKYKKKSEVYIIDIRTKLSELLRKEDIKGKVYGRVKNIYSIYKKLNRRNRTSINEIFDILALRVVLPDMYKNNEEFTGHLYSLLGAIHRKFAPLENRFKDYVANPKYNGYRSLHTTVTQLSSLEPHYPVEIQIRTEGMHNEAEYGIASHWLYKQNSPNNSHVDIKKQIEWIKTLANFNENSFNNLSETEIFGDKVFVMTPLGEVKSLPKGATPVDFAYEVDIELGHLCSSAKVNGKSVPLDYELKNGELVEIIKKNEKKPNRYWIEFVKTEKAINAISSWFEGFEYDKFLKKGRKKINDVLMKMNKPILDTTLSILKNYKGKEITIKERENLLQDVGRGEIDALTLMQDVMPDIVRIKKGLDQIKGEEVISTNNKILVSGESNLPYKIASCCKPMVNDKIVGYITRGKGITVHKSDCKILKNIDKERVIDVSWGGNEIKKDHKKYQVHIEVEFMDRVGFLRDIATVIAERDGNIIDFKFKSIKNDKIKRSLSLEVENLKQFKEIIQIIRSVDGVTNVS